MRIFCLLITLLITTNSFALGKLGHRAVCHTAFQQLNQEQQNSLLNLLAQVPQSEVTKVNRYNNLPESMPLSFATACTWADAVKNESHFKALKPWHYINISRRDSEINEDSCKGGCITQAILYHDQQAINAQSPLEKIVALMFIGHWVGDIHQPLHVSYANDYGGNKIEVSPFKGKCKTMHWYWDDCLLYPKQYVEEGLDNYWQNKLASGITPEKKSEWLSSDVYSWASESLAITRSKTTKYCKLSGSKCKDIRRNKLTIDENYHTKNQAIITVRMQQASVRLSQLIAKHL